MPYTNQEEWGPEGPDKVVLENEAAHIKADNAYLERGRRSRLPIIYMNSGPVRIATPNTQTSAEAADS
jgi:hypothetical protein